jgi:hypothetical protein
MKRPFLIKHQRLRISFITLTQLFVLAASVHLFIWFVYKDVIPIQVNDPYALRKIAAVEKIKFYGNGTILDSDDLYKFKAEPKSLEKIARDLNFVETDSQSFEVEVLNFWNKPPYWWNPEMYKNIKWYKFISPNREATRYGGILHDLDSKTAYMQMWDT